MEWRVEVLLVGTGYSSTCTLVTDGSRHIVVDTGLSIQESALLDALARRGIAPGDVDTVINTHLHVDHCGNNAMFPRATIFMSRPEWSWTQSFYGALFGSRKPEDVTREFYPEIDTYDVSARTIRNVARMARMFWDERRLGTQTQFRFLEDTPLPLGLDLLATPGHTPHHVSIRVTGSAPIVIAGDAVLAEDADAKVKTMIPFSRAQFASTRAALLATGERIVPGHGVAFTPALQPDAMPPAARKSQR